ncbi:SPRY-domain-containing protein [Parathielavia appendiculata]|uniref:SPRY-domain-containing protein n=1 Tax=Parathielavia appendiculata TaxID=2587402 RepID=A0AAN6Z0K5_9PEZI|nr:SPRY-domain-containing protein [Parathielavia appendiculata]
MTNPYQQYSPSNFDSSASGRLPPLNARRPSYASVVSGGPSALTRPAHSGFSHLLNPSPDSEPQTHSSNPYSAAHSPMFHADMTYTQNGGSSEGVLSIDPLGQTMGTGLWPPRLGSSFPYFSRAFDLYMSKDPLLPADPMSNDDVRFPSVAPMPNVSSSGFLSPSYLRGTIYLQKLEEKHRADVLAERERSAAKVGPPSSSPIASRLSSNESSSHLPLVGTKVSGSSHRGVAYDIVEKPMFPAEEEDDDAVSPLPSRWNKDDKEAALEVLSDGYEVRHTGRASSDHEASAVRADHYMSPSCGVYYFEITVLNTRSDKVKNPPIAIGFASKEASISRAPGWEPDSWGYHGDDGHSYASQNVGKPYAEIFGVGDTVGCLVNFRLNHALFTKNGRELPIAFKDISFKDVKGKLYPIVGLKKKEDHIMANFGQRPFMFDIDGYMKKQRASIIEEIRLADTSWLVDGLSETDLIQQLVLQFLQHDGYVETARAFAEELQEEKKALRLTPDEPVQGINVRDDEDAHNRQRIRRAVLEGDIDCAMRYTNTYYPTVLRENEQVYFRLRCRKFIEMIRKEAVLNMQLEEQRRNSHRGATNEPRADDGENGDEEMLGAGIITTAAATTTGGGQDNDLDMTMVEDGAAGDDVAAAGVSKLSQELLAYGMELRAEFKGDPRRETARRLDEIFSLIAYPNPLKVKEVAHLLDGSGRVAVAEELNSAVLTSLGKSSRAALENVYAQTCVLLEELRKDGGDGAFVTVESVVESIPPSRLR